MPFDVFCDGECGRMIAQGVRFNAEKTHVGKYFTTPIVRFKMKCERCAHVLVIETDPEHGDFAVVSGCRRRDPGEDAPDGFAPEITADEKKLIENDPMYRLEHGLSDKARADVAKPVLVQLQEAREVMRDDYDLIGRARKVIREEKREEKRVWASLF